jgi:AbrB family looped-hinge helix DNA binding protein
MPSATVTSKGQITIPQPVRRRLGLKTGDRVEFTYREDGVVLRAKRLPFEKLRGILKDRGKTRLTVPEMDQAIAGAVVAKWERASKPARR